IIEAGRSQRTPGAAPRVRTRRRQFFTCEALRSSGGFAMSQLTADTALDDTALSWAGTLPLPAIRFALPNADGQAVPGAPPADSRGHVRRAVERPRACRTWSRRTCGR